MKPGGKSKADFGFRRNQPFAAEPKNQEAVIQLRKSIFAIDRRDRSETSQSRTAGYGKANLGIPKYVSDTKGGQLNVADGANMQRSCRFENAVPVAPCHTANIANHGRLVRRQMSCFPSVGVTKKTEENHFMIPSEEDGTSEEKPISCAFSERPKTCTFGSAVTIKAIAV